jgi:hypothetical protein
MLPHQLVVCSKNLGLLVTYCCRISLGRSLCGCVCWGTALMVSLWGLPGPDAPVDADFVYKDVVTSLVNHAQVLPRVCVISPQLGLGSSPAMGRV